MTQVTKRSIANSIFTSHLPQRTKLGNRGFRKTVLVEIEAKTGVNHQSATAMYNYAKRRAVEVGLTPDFSRSAKEGTLAHIEAPTHDTNLPWAVVCPEKGRIVNTFSSRAKAKAQAPAGMMIEKTLAVKF